MAPNRKFLFASGLVIIVAAGVWLYSHQEADALRPETIEHGLGKLLPLNDLDADSIVPRPAADETLVISPRRTTGSVGRSPNSSDIWDTDYDRARAADELLLKEKAIEHGFLEIGDPHNSYRMYDADTLVRLADANDPLAQAYAVIHHSIPLEKRLEYAFEAASAGYTAGLVRMSGSGDLTRSQFLGTNDVALSAVKYGFLVAADQLDDPIAHRILIQEVALLQKYTGKLTDADREQGYRIAEKIVDKVEATK